MCTEVQVVDAAKGLIDESLKAVALSHARKAIEPRDFNLFWILGVGHLEVSTHSAFIGDLLNPKGRHAQGPFFLRRFLKHIGIPDVLDPESSRVYLEHYLGPKTEKTGGRIDILIQDASGRRVVIENKIHASEQAAWVTRYSSILKPGDVLFYLTLNGSRPTGTDTVRQFPPRCISYRKEIRAWVEICIQDNHSVPIIRENLRQYLDLIMDLTDQLSDEPAHKALVGAILADDQSFTAYRALLDARRTAWVHVADRFSTRIAEKLPRGFTLMNPLIGSGEKGDGMTFRHPSLDKLGLLAAIEFDRPDLDGCFYGFKTAGEFFPDDDPTRISIHTTFQEREPSAKSTPYWPAWEWFPFLPESGDGLIQLMQFGSDQIDRLFQQMMQTLFAVTELVDLR